MLLGKLNKVALSFAGGCDNMLARLVAQLLNEHIHNNKILTHRFAGGARLCNYVKYGVFHVDYVEQCVHTFGVDVVDDVQTGIFANGTGQFVVVQMLEGVEQRGGTQRRTADTQYDECVAAALHFRSGFKNFVYNAVLIVGA